MLGTLHRDGGERRFLTSVAELHAHHGAVDWSGFFEQVIMPMLRQRNPQARRQATDTLAELSRLGQSLRAAMLRQALRQYLEGS